jgi:acetoin utilization deacetylase AcuC-like enzyme
MRYGLVLDPVFLEHQVPPEHPERPDRLRAISQRLSAHSAFNRLVQVAPAPAAEEAVLRVHTQDHVANIRGTRYQPLHPLDWDTYSGGASPDVALLAAGSVIRMIELLFRGDLDSGFAAVRPPGHHAEPGKAMGFCLFNNVAVGAQWALDQGLVRRLAIVDFDVHHGNGTQAAFYHRDDVLYVSMHQHPLYPGTGYYTEVGVGKGKGMTVNFPIPAGQTNGFYSSLLLRMVLPILSSYEPELILVSAGFDAHRDDPLAGMLLDERGYARMAADLNRAAAKLCGGRILYVLEGGYNLKALAASVETTVAAGLDPPEAGPGLEPSPNSGPYMEQLRPALSSYWPV